MATGDFNKNIYSGDEYKGPSHYTAKGHPPAVIVQPSVFDDSCAGMYLSPDPALPIVHQPSSVVDTSPISISGNLPPSLEFLRTVNVLQIKQHIELLEMITGFETKNRFTIYNQDGQVVFYAKEDSDCCARQCCGPARPFDMEIFDVYKQKVIHLNRPLRCACFCCFCCLNTMEVSSPPGTLVGTIDQTISFFSPNYDIKNELGDVMFRIKSPVFPCSCGDDVVFKVISVQTGEQVATIRKKWTGCLLECFTDADNFTINYLSSSLDVKMKATLLGMVFLIDVMLFERKKNN